MTTALDLITRALQDIGVLSAEESPSSADANRGLNLLNNLIAEWNTQDLMVYNIEENIFNYVAGQKDYTLGSGGDFNIDRPVVIESAYNRYNNGLQTEVDYPIQVITDSAKYSDIITKEIQTQLPIVVYDNGNYPLKTLSFWPVPSDTSYRPVLWTWKMVSAFALSDTLSLPPGYESALEFNLAKRMAIPFGVTLTDLLNSTAIDTKASIARINTRIPVLKTGFNNSRTYALPDFLAGV